MEDRTLPSTYVVTTTADSGQGSLRDAINQVDNGLFNEIDFNITAVSDILGGGTGYNPITGVATIAPPSALPAITNTVLIDGYTQGANTPLAASQNSLSQGDNAVLKIDLSGALYFPDLGYSGLTINAANSTVQGLAVNGFMSGAITVQSGDTVAGCFIGTDVTGNQAVQNNDGVMAGNGNTIGGTTAAARNVISGNTGGDANGVWLHGTGNLVEGNYIGTDATGEYALGNGNGVWLDGGATNNTISGNVISANTDRVGVGLENFNSINLLMTGNVVQNNLIGTDASGQHSTDPNGHSLGNPYGVELNYADGNSIQGNTIAGNVGYGITVFSSSNNLIQSNAIYQNNGTGIELALNAHPCSGNLIQGNAISQNSGNGIQADAPNNTVGGTVIGAGNTISGNGGAGVLVHANVATGVSILGNSISANGGLGIGLVNGGNNNQAAPVLFAATSKAGSTYVGGALASVPNTTFRIEFFSNASPDPSGYGQGQTYLGFVNVTTDGSGNADFIATLAGVSAAQPYISATATRLAGATPTDTSGFANDVHALAAPSPYVVTTTADSGPHSLRDAINQIDLDTNHVLYASPSNANVDEIDFNITAASDTGGGFNPGTGVATIAPTSELPWITNTALIDGYTQSGASKNTLSQGDNAVLKVQLDENAVSALDYGLALVANNSTIRGLVVNHLTQNGTFAIYLLGTGDHVEGNFIGTDVSGTSIVGGSATNTCGVGFNVYPGVVGGTTPDARNIIAGYTTGINAAYVPAEGAVIEGNYIGTDASGTKGLGNQTGVFGGTVGGTSSGAGNLISGNQLGISGSGLVEGNLIGTDVTGTIALGNGTGIQPGDGSTIGGTTAAARNIISGNFLGMFVEYAPNTLIEGNFIGTDITGTKALATPASYSWPEGNHDGIWLWTGGETIGGTAPGAGNVISGNSDIGIRLFGSNSTIEGNYIGTDTTGTIDLGNLQYGVYDGDGSSNDVVGGLAPGAGNIIAYNQYGVQPVGGLSIAELSNSMYGNEAFYINPSPFFQTVVSSPAGLTVSGTAPSAVVQVFANATAGDAQGRTLLDTITNDASGNFTATIPAADLSANEPFVSASLTGVNSDGTYGGTGFFQNVGIPTVSAGGPYTMIYGNSLTLSASGSDPDGDPLTYSWTINGHAGAATGANPTITWSQLAALGVASLRSFNVSVTASDGNVTSAISAAVPVTVKEPLTVNPSSSMMLVGNNPPLLIGSINGTPFTGSITYTTTFGDQITVTLSTTATSSSAVGQYPITATLSGTNASNYFIDPTTSTVGTMYVVSLGTDPSSTTGAKAVTFWDNKGNKAVITAAELASLDALNLVNQGGADFDPKSVAQLQAWLSTSPNATTSYQLAVQLAVMDLNVLGGYVHATDLVYAGALLPYASTYGITGLTSGGFIDVQDLMNAANAILGQVSPGVPSGDPNQAYEAALAQVLQAANLNSDFVSQELLWGLVGTFV